MIMNLLSFRDPSPEAIQLCIYYGICAGIILIAFMCIGIFKRKTKNQLRPVTVKKACLRAKKFTQKLIEEQEGHHNKTVFVTAKLNALSNCVADASWYGFQIVEAKKDLVLDGIANGVDALATEISKMAELGYVPTDEYLSCLKDTVAGLDKALEKLERYGV